MSLLLYLNLWWFSWILFLALWEDVRIFIHDILIIIINFESFVWLLIVIRVKSLFVWSLGFLLRDLLRFWRHQLRLRRRQLLWSFERVISSYIGLPLMQRDLLILHFLLELWVNIITTLAIRLTNVLVSAKLNVKLK